MSSIAKHSTRVPRVLNLLEYAEQRRQQTEALIDVVDKSTSSLSRSIHNRRRTKSFKKPSSDLIKFHKRGQRKLRRDRRRRRSRLQRQIEDQEDQPRKLETHLWHVKRFHMTSNWRYLLPENALGTIPCNIRILRNLDQFCILRDGSYWRSTVVTGPCNELRKGLIHISDSQLVQKWFHDVQFLKGEVEVLLPVFHFQSCPLKWIGFAKLLLFPSTDSSFDSKLLIWTHPSVWEEFKNALQCCVNTSIHIADCNLQRLELLGGHSMKCLRELIPDLPVSGELRLDNGRVLGIRSLDPRLMGCQLQDSTPLSNASTKVLELTNFFPCLDKDNFPYPISEKAISLYWKNSKRNEIYTQAEDECSGLLRIRDWNEVQGKESTCITFWIVFHSTSSCSLCLPKHWVLPFWKKLVLKGCKVAGVDDWASAKIAMQLIPYPEAFVKVDSGPDPIFISQQLHDWPQKGDGAVLLKVKVIDKGVCKLNAQIFISNAKDPHDGGQNHEICGEVLWSFRPGLREYPGGFASCSLLVLSKALDIEQAQLLQNSKEDINLLIKNPRSNALRTAVGQIILTNNIQNLIL